MRSFLLDSCTLLWASYAPELLSPRAQGIVANTDNFFTVSHATIWELSIKVARGKLTLPKNFFNEIENAGYSLLPTALKHFDTLRKLPLLHRDPFDRLLIAQSIAEEIPLITCDPEITRYDVETVW